MDHFSKFHVLFPLKSKTAREVAQLLEEHVLAYLGAPRIFQSDNGREFVNTLLHALLKQWKCGIVTLYSSIVGHGIHSDKDWWKGETELSSIRLQL